MSTTYMSSKLVLSVTLLPAVVVSSGLGPLAVLAPEGASPLGAGYQEVADADDVATLLAATNITQDGADQLLAAFSQDYTPSKVYVATYDDGSEDPTDAIAILEAASIDVQVLVVATVDDTDLSAVGTWLATGVNRWKYLVIAESLNAELITSGKSAQLTACEVSSFRLLYGAASQELAGAYGGKVQGRGLTSGPAAGEVRLLGVDLPGITDAEIAFGLANDVGVLLPVDAGASASARIVRGTKTYDASSFTAIVSALYAVRRMTEALQSLVLRKAILGDALLATAVGVGEVRAALTGPLEELSGQGHFVAGTSGSAPNEVHMPSGYSVDITISGAQLLAAVTLRLGQEVETITLAVTGEIV